MSLSVLTFLVCLKNSYLPSETLPGITCYHSHFCIYHFHTWLCFYHCVGCVHHNDTLAYILSPKPLRARTMSHSSEYFQCLTCPWHTVCVQELSLNWSESRFFLCRPSSTNAFEGLIILILVLSVQFSSFAQSCSTLCSPMDCSMPFFPVHYQLLELAQTQVHQVGDAIKPSHLVLYYILTQRFPIVLWSYKFW